MDDKLFELHLTRAELAAVVVGFANTSDRLRQEGDGGVVQAIADAIEGKARLLLAYAEAEFQRVEAYHEYQRAVYGDEYKVFPFD